jgi:hypothetical protein
LYIKINSRIWIRPVNSKFHFEHCFKIKFLVQTKKLRVTNALFVMFLHKMMTSVPNTKWWHQSQTQNGDISPKHKMMTSVSNTKWWHQSQTQNGDISPKHKMVTSVPNTKWWHQSQTQNGDIRPKHKWRVRQDSPRQVRSISACIPLSVTHTADHASITLHSTPVGDQMAENLRYSHAIVVN